MTRDEQRQLAERLEKCADGFIDRTRKGHSKGFREMERAAGIKEGWTAVTVHRLTSKDGVTFEVDKAIALARACNVSLDWLLTGKEAGLRADLAEHVHALARAIPPPANGTTRAPTRRTDVNHEDPPVKGDLVTIASRSDEHDLSLTGSNEPLDPKPTNPPAGKGRKGGVPAR